MNKFIRITIGLLVSALFLWLSFRNFNFKSLAEIHNRFIPFWLIPTLLFYLTAELLRSLRWHLLLSTTKKTTPFKLFPHLMFGFMVNNMLPARAGEFARTYTVARMFEIPFSTVLGSIALERLSDIVGLMTVMLLTLRALPISQLPIHTLVFTLLGGLLALMLLSGLYVFLTKHTSTKNHGMVLKITKILDHLTLSLRSLKSPTLVLSVSGLSIVIWLIEVCIVCSLMKVFDASLSFFQGAATLSGVSIGVMIPASPGYVGTYEYFGTSILKLLGYPADLALAFILTLHLFSIVMCFILGMPVLFKFGLPLPQSRKMVKDPNPE